MINDAEHLFLFKQNFKEGLLWASLVAQMVKNLLCRRTWFSSRSERSLGEGNGYPLQYSCLENSVDRPWGQEESDTTE